MLGGLVAQLRLIAPHPNPYSFVVARSHLFHIVVAASHSQEELQSIQEAIADELAESGLRSKLNAQIAAARLGHSVPGVGPVSTPTVVEALQKKFFRLEDGSAIAAVVNAMANYDSPDSTVMAYLAVADKPSHEAWMRVAHLRARKDQLINCLHEKERILEEAYRGSGTLAAKITYDTMKQVPPTAESRVSMSQDNMQLRFFGWCYSCEHRWW